MLYKNGVPVTDPDVAYQAGLETGQADFFYSDNLVVASTSNPFVEPDTEVLAAQWDAGYQVGRQ